VVEEGTVGKETGVGDGVVDGLCSSAGALQVLVDYWTKDFVMSKIYMY
jgi:hypothetical protein